MDLFVFHKSFFITRSVGPTVIRIQISSQSSRYRFLSQKNIDAANGEAFKASHRLRPLAQSNPQLNNFVNEQQSHFQSDDGWLDAATSLIMSLLQEKKHEGRTYLHIVFIEVLMRCFRCCGEASHES